MESRIEPSVRQTFVFDCHFKTSLRAYEIPRSVSRTVNNFFHYGLHLRPKKATHTAEMLSVLCVAIFWVLNASSGEKSCLQFSIPTGSGKVEREVFYIVLRGCWSRSFTDLK